MSHPTVSIVMPAYNAASTIGASISGVLTQSHSECELIVVDDGSSDCTRDIVAAHASKGVRLVEGAHGGAASARNIGLREAKGDFIAFVDSDDVIMPNYVEKSLETWRTADREKTIVTNNAHLLTPTGIAVGRRFAAHTMPSKDEQRYALLQFNFVTILSVFPAAVLDDVAGFDASLGYNEDWHFWLSCAFSGWTFTWQPEPTALYRWVGTGKSSTKKDKCYDAQHEIVSSMKANYGGIMTPREQEFVEARLSISEPFREIVSRAEDALREGRLDDARRDFARAADLVPSDKRYQLRNRIIQAPLGARAMQARLARIDRQIGYHSGMQH